MKLEIVVLGKNFYEIESQKGANLVILGDYEETNNKSGISISESVIDFDEHNKVNVFPGRYRCDGQLVSTKNKNGKSITTIKLSNLQLIEKLELVGVKNESSK